jgi:hypothetical protein
MFLKAIILKGWVWLSWFGEIFIMQYKNDALFELVIGVRTPHPNKLHMDDI